MQTNNENASTNNENANTNIDYANTNIDYANANIHYTKILIYVKANIDIFKQKHCLCKCKHMQTEILACKHKH